MFFQRVYAAESRYPKTSPLQMMLNEDNVQQPFICMTNYYTQSVRNLIRKIGHNYATQSAALLKYKYFMKCITTCLTQHNTD